MTELSPAKQQRLARLTGWTLIGTIILGILTSIFIAKGIDINLSADVVETSENMLAAESRLRAKAYIALLFFGLDIFVLTGLYFILKKDGPILSMWSFILGLGGAILTLLGAVYAMNAAHIGGNDAYQALASAEQRHLLAGLQATSDYTSFHLALLLSTSAKAGFFLIFLRSGMIPAFISGWGVFASVFVVTMIIARDFIPVLGNNYVTFAFMLSNLLAIVSLGLYLGIKGTRLTA